MHGNDRTDIVKHLLKAHADVCLKGIPFSIMALALMADICPQDDKNRTPLELAEANPLCPSSILTLLHAAASPTGITEHEWAKSKDEAEAEAKAEAKASEARTMAEAEAKAKGESPWFKTMLLSTQQQFMDQIYKIGTLGDSDDIAHEES
jgi:hypothetical protein